MYNCNNIYYYVCICNVFLFFYYFFFKVWKAHSEEKMREAGKREKEIAISKGQIINGKPYTTVILDGGWNKRTYGHSFNASSGVVSIRPIYNLLILI